MALPIIGTNDIPKPAQGTVVESRPVKAAIELIEKNGLLFEGHGLEIGVIKLSTPWSLVTEYTNGMEVTFGLSDLDRGLADLKDIVTHAESMQREIATVNVVVSRNIPVKFFNPPDPAALPAVQIPPTPAGPPGPSIRAVPVNPEKAEQQRQLQLILNGG